MQSQTVPILPFFPGGSQFSFEFISSLENLSGQAPRAQDQICQASFLVSLPQSTNIQTL